VCVCGVGVVVVRNAVCLHMEMMQNDCVVTEGKRPLGRTRRRWGKFKLRLKEIGVKVYSKVIYKNDVK